MAAAAPSTTIRATASVRVTGPTSPAMAQRVASYGAELAEQTSRAVRTLLDGERYPFSAKLREDSRSVGRFETKEGARSRRRRECGAARLDAGMVFGRPANPGASGRGHADDRHTLARG
jgi:hypothetical protein